MLKHTSGYDDILLRVQQMKHNTLMLDKRNGGNAWILQEWKWWVAVVWVQGAR